MRTRRLGRIYVQYRIRYVMWYRIRYRIRYRMRYGILLHHPKRPANRLDLVSYNCICYDLETPASYRFFLRSTKWIESLHVPLRHVPCDRPVTQFISVCGQSYAQTASLTSYKSIAANQHAWRGPHWSKTPLFWRDWRNCTMKNPLLQHPVWLGIMTLLHP